MKKIRIWNILITLIVGLVLYFFLLPPINVTSMGFWVFVMMLLFVFIFITFIDEVSITITRIRKNDYRGLGKLALVLFIIPILIVVVNFILSPMFNSRAFSQRINVVEDTEENNFITEVKEVDFKSLPLLDKDSSSRLGDRVMGQMPELVSQFYVSSLYTQINYNNEIIRVTPLEYNGLFKYISNYKDGVTGYITVNSVDGES